MVEAIRDERSGICEACSRGFHDPRIILPGPADAFGRGYQGSGSANAKSVTRPESVRKSKTLRPSKSGRGTSEILHPVARVSDGSLVDVDDESSPPYYCVDSRHPMVACRGAKITDYFRHLAGENCETDLHRVAKEYICQGLNRWFSGESEYLMVYKCPRCGRMVEEPPPIFGQSAEVERQILDGIRPDVTVYDEAGEPTTAIEVVVHNDVPRSKAEKFVLAGITVLVVTPSFERLRMLGNLFHAYVACSEPQIRCRSCVAKQVEEEKRREKADRKAKELESSPKPPESMEPEPAEPDGSEPDPEPVAVPTVSSIKPNSAGAGLNTGLLTLAVVLKRLNDYVEANRSRPPAGGRRRKRRRTG